MNLEVRHETKLLLWVERFATSKHVFHGRLLTKSGSVVDGKAVKAYLNGSLLDETLITNTTGYFSFERNFDPGEGKVFYSLEVVYEGSDNMTATLNGTGFMGDPYIVCQTIQFDYKPSSNMTSITIEPQASGVTVIKKTHEEMQAEAEDEGWLVIWHELMWCYPWYRLHLQININPRIHVGFNPLLSGGEIFEWEGLEIFAAVLEEIIEEVTIDVIGLFIGYLAAKALSVWNPACGILAEATKGGLQFFLLVVRNWNDKIDLLVSAMVNIMMGLFALIANIGKIFIQVLLKLTSASTALLSLHFKLLHVLFIAQFSSRWWLDVIEIAIDFTLAGVAFVRYCFLG